MLNKILKRLQNKKVALSVASGILLILVNVGAIDMAMSDKVTEIVNTVLSIGVAIGIFTNPDKPNTPAKTE